MGLDGSLGDGWGTRLAERMAGRRVDGVCLVFWGMGELW
jgi:hypothetical protein